MRYTGSCSSQLTVSLPGTFHYYFTSSQGDQLPGPEGELPRGCGGAGHLLVSPVLHLQGAPLPLDSLMCQTVLSKLLGPLDSWRDKLEVASQSGFNMVHFTPVQRWLNTPV